MTPATEWTREEACRIRKKAYRFFLRDGRIWKHPKKRNSVPLRVVTKEEEQEELRQLQRRPEDVEQAAERLRAARVRNKDRFDRTHRLRPKKIEEGDWVLVYDSSLDHQHKATRKFARRWFGPYVVTTVNGNGAYHLAELDGTRIAVPVAGKRIKAFKKRHEGSPDLRSEESDDGEDGTGGDPEGAT
jgi:hypothetical protein